MLRVAFDLGIHEYIVKSDGAVSTSHVAAAAGADPTLMQRILRNLASFGHIEEVGVDLFHANKFSKAMTTPKAVHGARFS